MTTELEASAESGVAVCGASATAALGSVLTDEGSRLKEKRRIKWMKETHQKSEPTEKSPTLRGILPDGSGLSAMVSIFITATVRFPHANAARAIHVPASPTISPRSR